MTATASTEAPPATPAKRARLLAATGLPAVLIAGGVILPTIAQAAPAPSGACPAGTTPSPLSAAAQKAAVAPATPLPSASSGATSGAAKQPGTPSTPQPTGSTPAKPQPPAPSGTAGGPSSVPAPSAPSTSTATTNPTTPAPPTSTTPAAPPPTWWAPWTWFSTTTPSAQVFNPQPVAQAGIRNAAVNQLGTAKVANPAVVAALATTGSSTPSTPATSGASSTPSTPAAPTATGTPTTGASSAPSTAPSGTAPSSTAPTSAAPTEVCVKAATPGAMREALWHLDATSLTLYSMTYNGVVTVNTAGGPVNVLDFHADSVDVVSMVTYSANPTGGKNDFSNGGKGKTVHLTNVHLHVLQQTGNLGGLIPLTLAPGNLVTNLLGIAQGVPVPIPMYFTDVHVDQYLLTADTLSVPGFNVHQDQ